MQRAIAAESARQLKISEEALEAAKNEAAEAEAKSKREVVLGPLLEWYTALAAIKGSFSLSIAIFEEGIQRLSLVPGLEVNANAFGWIRNAYIQDDIGSAKMWDSWRDNVKQMAKWVKITPPVKIADIKPPDDEHMKLRDSYEEVCGASWDLISSMEDHELFRSNNGETYCPDCVQRFNELKNALCDKI
jgi:hypothetical protein